MIDLKPDTEAKLKALAQSAGLSVDDFLLSLVSSTPLGAKSGSVVDSVAEFRLWIKNFSTSGPGLPGEAISRESIYER